MRPVECARAALAGCGVSYTNMESGNVLPTPDLPLGSRCCHGAPLLTNSSRHPADYKAPGWKSTCGRWGCAGAAVAGCGVELHQNGERERVLHTRLAIRFPAGCHGAPLLTNPSRHPVGDRAPGWRSTCGRWGCAGAALAGCGVELHQKWRAGTCSTHPTCH